MGCKIHNHKVHKQEREIAQKTGNAWEKATTQDRESVQVRKRKAKREREFNCGRLREFEREYLTWRGMNIRDDN